jgi:transmembrane protein TMEM260 (protein O-mannosyltransferase)
LGLTWDAGAEVETKRNESHLIETLLAASRRRGVLSFFVPVAAFLIYLRTLAPGLLSGDSGEFQFAAWGWTLAHPTGYPLYLLIGGIWQHLIPLGDPAYRLNLLSAVFSALAVGVCYRIFVDIAGHRGAALIAAMTFAVAPTFWSQATETEVYALNTLFIAVLIRLALKWQARRDFRYSAAWALTFGLSLAHHRSILLLIPAFAAFFAEAVFERAGRYTSWRERLGAHWLRRDIAYAALVALPLFLYAYVPLRASVTPYTRLLVSPAQMIVTFDNTPAGWISHIAGRSFEFELGFDAASITSLEALPRRLLTEFNPLGTVLGLAGLISLFYRRRLELVALTVFGFAAIVLFDVSYHIGDIADFYTPAYLFFAIWIASALGTILQYVSHHTHLRTGLLPTIVLLIAAAGLPVENFSASFVEQDRSLHTEWRDRWEAILGSDLPRNAILISNDRDEMTPMWYLQLVKGLRTDTLGLFPQISPDAAYSNVMRVVDSVIDSGRPVFLIKSIPGVALRYRLESAPAGLVRVADAPLTAPSSNSRAVVGDQLEVLGYRITSGEAHPDGSFTIAVYWRPLLPLGRDYTTSLQIFDEMGRKVAQGDDHRPGGDTYPTSQWQPGETLQDLFRVAMRPDTHPGLYRLFVKVYDPLGDNTLGDLTEIGTLDVSE